MPLREPIALLAALLLLAPPARQSHAAVAHGLSHAAVGAAVLSTSTDGSLSVSNIGSSGQDGVSVQMPTVTGSLIRLRTKIDVGALVAQGGGSVPEQIVGFYRLPGDATPLLRSTRHGAGGGGGGAGGFLHSVEIPGASSITIEVWSATQLVLSQAHPPNTPVMVSASVVAADTTRTLIYRAKQGSSGSAQREVSLTDWRDQDCDFEVGGVTVTGRMLVFSAELPGPPEAASEARMLFASEQGLPPGEVVIESMGISSGEPSSPPAGAPRALDAHVRGGALVVADSSPGALSYAPDGTGAAMTLSLMPRTPVLAVPSVRRLDLGLGSRPPAIEGHAQRFEADVEVGEDSGLPPSLHLVALEWTATPGDACDVSAASTIPGDELFWQVRLTGRPVGQPSAAGLGSHVQCSARPTGYSVTSDGSHVAHALRFATASTFQAPGSPPLVGDELVWLAHASSTASTSAAADSGRRRISDVRIVHPPGTPPGTWRVTGGSGSLHDTENAEGGRDVSARGPRQTVLVDETHGGGGSGGHNRRLPVRNLGSSGQDGVDVRMRGLPSVAFELIEDPADVPPAAMRLELLPCADGTCAPSSEVDIEDSPAHLRVRKGMQDLHHRVLFVQVSGGLLPFASADLDGDGWLELGAPPSNTGAAAVRGKVKSIKDNGNGYSSVTSLEFTGPVAIQCDDGLHVVTELHLWRNPGGQPNGLAIAEPQLARLTARPSADPVAGRHGACDLTMQPPGLRVSGSLSIRPGVDVIRAGIPTRATWGEAEGALAVSAGASSDEMTLVRTGADSPGSPPAVLHASPGPDDDCDGFLLERTPTSSSVVWSPRSILRLSVEAPSSTGGAPETLHALDWDDDGGAPPELRYVPGSAGGGTPTVRVYSSGALVSEQPADLVTMSHSPTAVFAGGDLDGDGRAEFDLRGLPGGATVHVGGIPYPCDRVTFSAPLGLPASRVSSAHVSLHGLPPGVPVEGVRLSQVVLGGATTSITPGRPATSALELRGVMPNPSRGASAIRLALAGRARVRAEVLDIAGRAVALLHEGELAAGEHALTWSGLTSGGRRVAAGLYLVRVSGDGLRTQTTRIVRLD